MFLLRHAGEICYRQVAEAAPGARLAEIAHKYRNTPLFPHVLVVEAGTVKAVLSADCYRALRRDQCRDHKVDAYADPRFIVLGAEDMMFDVLAELLDHDAEIAVVTRRGTLASPEEVTGVLVLTNLVSSYALPLEVLRQRSRKPPDTAH